MTQKSFIQIFLVSTIVLISQILFPQYKKLKNGLYKVPSGKWRIVDPGSFGGLNELAQHPVTGTIFAVSDMGHSVLRSTNAGKTYHPMCPKGHPTPQLLLPHPQKAGVWYSMMNNKLTGNGIYKTTDDGETWQNLLKVNAYFNPEVCGVLLPGKIDTLMFLVQGKAYLSTDGGKTLKDFSQGLSKNKHGSAIAHHGTLSPFITYSKISKTFFVINNGIYKRKLIDPAWIKIDLPVKNAKPSAITCDTVKDIVWVSLYPRGIIKINAATTKIEIVNPNINAIAQIQTHPKKPGIVWIWRSSAGLYKSTDSGKTWEWLSRHFKCNNESYQENTSRIYGYPQGIGYNWCLVSPWNPDIIYLPDHTSYDGGQTFKRIQAAYNAKNHSWRGNGLTLLATYQVWFDNFHPNRAYIGFSDSGLMRSDNRGYSVKKIVEISHNPSSELNYYKHKYKIHDWGGCFSFAADPDSPGTYYYVISGRSLPSGGIFKTPDDARTWIPIPPYESGLPNGTITDLLIFRGEGYTKRKMFTIVNSLADKNGDLFKTKEQIMAALKSRDNFKTRGGLYVSLDSGVSWKKRADINVFRNALSLMCLRACESKPQIMLLSSSAQGKRPAGSYAYIKNRPGDYGGIWLSKDEGKNWKSISTFDMANCPEVAIHPHNPSIMYAACVDGPAVNKDGKKIMTKGGLFVTENGGQTWTQKLDFNTYKAILSGKGGNGCNTVCVNPEFPDIVYTGINAAGVFRSLDRGQTWERIDWEHFRRFQANYHTLNFNPHDPAEFYLALFGNAFVAYRDPVLVELLKKTYPQRKKNLIKNGDFELLDMNNVPSYWQFHNLKLKNGKTVLTVAKSPDGKKSKCLAISSVPSQTDKSKLPDTWAINYLSPFNLALARGKKVKVSCTAWMEAASGYRPALELHQRIDSCNELLAEVKPSLVYSEPGTPFKNIQPAQKAKWQTFASTARVSKNAERLMIVLYTSRGDWVKGFFDNVKLEIVE